LRTRFGVICSHKFHASNEFRSKFGKPIDSVTPPPQVPSQPEARKRFIDRRFGKWVIVATVVFLILVIPVFPKYTIVYVNGTTQTVTNEIQYTTALQTHTVTTTSKIKVYIGYYQYFTNYSANYYYTQCTYCCYWYSQQLICNYLYWPWYKPSYGKTVTVTPAQRVVSVTTQQSGDLETLTLTYYNGRSTTVQNVYNDQLRLGGTAKVQSTAVLTSTITNTITTPVTQTLPCYQCVPERVTEHVSILQLLLGY
jgi:hypothetical protein